jgi:hypothetical protein
MKKSLIHMAVKGAFPAPRRVTLNYPVSMGKTVSNWVMLSYVAMMEGSGIA